MLRQLRRRQFAEMLFSCAFYVRFISAMRASGGTERARPERAGAAYADSALERAAAPAYECARAPRDMRCYADARAEYDGICATMLFICASCSTQRAQMNSARARDERSMPRHIFRFMRSSDARAPSRDIFCGGASPSMFSAPQKILMQRTMRAQRAKRVMLMPRESQARAELFSAHALMRYFRAAAERPR